MAKIDKNQFAALVSAVLTALPRDLDVDVAQGWIENPKGLEKVLCEALVPLSAEKSRNGLVEVTIGGRVYEVLSFPNDKDTPATMVEWAKEMGAHGISEMEHVCSHVNDIPSVFGDKIFVFTQDLRPGSAPRGIRTLSRSGPPARPWQPYWDYFDGTPPSQYLLLRRKSA